MALEKGWLTSGAFAELCGTTRETLRHYKDIGLLNPAHQGERLLLLHGGAVLRLLCDLGFPADRYAAGTHPLLPARTAD